MRLEFPQVKVGNSVGSKRAIIHFQMALKVGSKLGPYEIVAPLGAGGMGEVYRARDTRLERTVAIKVLPERFSKDTELKQRFEREAKTIIRTSVPCTTLATRMRSTT